MTRKNPDDSVRKEQNGADDNAAVSEKATQADKAKEPDSLPEGEGMVKNVDVNVNEELPLAVEGNASHEDTSQDEIGSISESQEVIGQTETETKIEKADDDTDPEVNASKKKDAIKASTKKEPIAKVKTDKDTKSVEEAEEGEADEASAENSVRDSIDKKKVEEVELPPVDYSGYSKSELVETLALIIENRPPAEIRDDVDRIKTHFYKKLKLEEDERKDKFLEEGGKIEDYRAWIDPDDGRVKRLFEKYREKKTDFNKVQEAEKFENLKNKYDIIDRIKDLVNREESINKTFHEFRMLQNDWHNTGVVPQSSLKDLWENYHHAVEIFYDYIKINKELRDLDLKKNLEAKIVLCEKAEGLLLEPSPVSAFRSLQDLHNQWREIGPVPLESKNEIWDRFKEATSQINKRHHEYYENQKEEQRKNLEAKISLCEEVEAVNLLELKSFKDFDEKADKIVALQNMWRTIGFAPKKQNNKIYQRFREACDVFFEKKRNFYAENKELQLNNLQLKNELCIQAEALQESTDWKETTDALIKLQKEWKEVGPVPRKQSERCWKRFRKACDHFFNRKAEFFAELDTSYEDNLKAKLAIIEELKKFEPGTDVQTAFEHLKEIQKRWTEIGFVPFNMKDEITNKYRNALNKEFDKLKIGDEDKSILKYRTKLDNLKSNPKAFRKVRNEREKFFTKIKQLESDIVLWENNIGFFAKSTNADTMIREVEEKIEAAKKMIKTLEKKVRMIDQSGLDV